jgi:hypothetical protein
VRKLPYLADWSESSTERSGNRPGEEKSPALDCGYGRYPDIRIRLGHHFARLAKQPGVGEQRRDVLEDDAGLGEIRHVADGAAQMLDAPRSRVYVGAHAISSR